MTASFTVWAPKPKKVELLLGTQVVPMRPTTEGWWEATVENAGPGHRYGYLLDRGTVRPDPRSASQPDGVYGLSELVDHNGFEWTDGSWRGLPLAGAVLYELHVGTFTKEGTFDAVVDKLPHLVDLGVDAVELLPVAEFSGNRGWGYDGVHLYAPHHAYGGPSGLKRLVDACHRAGIGVVLDVVYNHLGPTGNYLGEFGPYFSERRETIWGEAVNFDGPGSDQVRSFVIANALTWLRDYHADGLRLDAVHAIVDDSAWHLLAQLAESVDALATHLRRPLFLIAETDANDPKVLRSRDAGGYGLDAAWANEWHHALHAALTGERAGYYEEFGSLELLAKALCRAWVYDGCFAVHRRRRHGRPPTGLTGHQFVVCTQNHDQVGNRAVGDRSSALMSDGRLRIAAALLLCGPFTPMLFQGEEWGASTPFQYFTDHRDPDLGRAVSDGRRREFANFGWDPYDIPDPQSERTFAASKLDWDENTQPVHAQLLDWYRRLLALRRSVPALSDPRLDRVDATSDREKATLRLFRGGVSLLVNLGDSDQLLPVQPGSKLLASSDTRIAIDDDRVLVPADSVAIVGPP
jgi:maltooligosyltrehalose trehalohydrolase